MTEGSRNAYSMSRLVIIAIGVALSVWVLVTAKSAFIPLVAGWALAYLTMPLVSKIGTRVKSHRTAVAIAMTLVLGLASLAFTLSAPVIEAEIRVLGELAKEATQPESSLWNKLKGLDKNGVVEGWIRSVTEDEIETFVLDDIDVKQMVGEALNQTLRAFRGVLGGAKAALGWLLTMMLTVVFWVFLLLDYQRFRGSWHGYIPSAWRETVVSFIGDLDDALRLYFRGQVLIASIVGLTFAIGFSLIGLELGFLFGLVVGALNLVPYLQVVAIPPALVLATLTALQSEASVGAMMSWTLAIFAVVQLMQEVVITPKVMGEATGLRPVVILFAVLLWGELLGFVGLLLAIPLSCVGLTWYKRAIEPPSVQP